MVCTINIFGLTENGELINLTWTNFSDGTLWEDLVIEVMQNNLVPSAIVNIAMVSYDNSYQECYKALKTTKRDSIEYEFTQIHF